jgi:hypothetical protein
MKKSSLELLSLKSGRIAEGMPHSVSVCEISGNTLFVPSASVHLIECLSNIVLFPQSSS